MLIDLASTLSVGEGVEQTLPFTSTPGSARAVLFVTQCRMDSGRKKRNMGACHSKRKHHLKSSSWLKKANSRYVSLWAEVSLDQGY